MLLFHLLTFLTAHNMSHSTLHQFNFNFENDFIYETDKFYNHSSKFDFIFYNEKAKYIKYNITYKNEMYTPEDHELYYVPIGDMPYTSLSEISAGMEVSNERISNHIEVGLGYTGKYTYSAEIMEFIHGVIPAKPVFNAWDTQKSFTPIFRLSYQNKYKYTIIDKYLDYIHNTSVSLSNFRSFVSTGGQLRLGLLDKSFGLYNSYSNNLNVLEDNKYHAYVLAGYNLKYTLNDTSMRGLDMIHEQYEYQLGIGIKYNSWNIDLINNVESKRFETQSTNSFGYSNVMIGYKF